MSRLRAATMLFAAVISLVVTALLPPIAAAQNIAPLPEGWIRPQLVIAGPIEVPVRLQQVSVRSQITGNLALTEVTLVFHNPNRRVLEGELQFPLLDGQQILSFAMDVNGRLREAVPVEKARGQTVFEDITRGRVDPGLLQITQGNNFRLRVYPIPALGTKQVVLRYSDTLRERKGAMAYRVPLEYAAAVESFRLDVTVLGANAPPVVSGQRGAPLDGLVFERSGGGFHGQVSRQHYAGRGMLEIEIEPPRGARAYTQVFEGQTYFYAELPVPSREAARVLPKIIGLVWDSSGSGATRDHAREFALLDAYFSRLRDGEVRLTRVRDAVEPAQSFRVVNGDWRSLRAALEATPYDGATNLGAFEADGSVREYLVFSDGLSNYGERSFPLQRVPVYTVSAAAKTDPTSLKHLAEASGGRYIDLTADTAPAAARKLLFAATRVVSMAADGATQLVTSSPYPERGRIAVAGRLVQTATQLRVTVAHPGASPVTLNVALRANESPFALVAPLWARFRIAELEAQYDLNRAEIRRLGQAFALVTRETSLIVLDSVEDYARYEIAPPPELRAEYDRLRQLAVQRTSADRSAHLNNVVRRYEDKIAWWNRDFPQDDKSASKALKPAERDTIATPRRNDSALRERAPLASARPAAPAQSGALRREAISPDLAVASASAEASGNQRSAATATIKLQPWEPDAPYAARMRRAAGDDVYRIYLDERPSYLNSTAFFLDAADILFEKQLPALALRVLSNLAEMDLENRHILRILGYRLLQAQASAGLALPVFRKILELSPEEPQSYRDLGLALAAAGQYQKAIEMLNEVVIRPWHGRFPDVEIITLGEMNAILATCGEKLDVSRLDPRLLKNLPVDLRVVLTWDADNTDIDLWVTDPNGEKAYYGNPLTYQGGRMSQDFTGGYGPEEFQLKRAKPGTYKVEAQYFGDRRQTTTGPTTLQVKLGTRFGSLEQKEQMITLRLKDRRESVFVGEFEVK